jgi:tetratricopeptide (TPR) repeat protein
MRKLLAALLPFSFLPLSAACAADDPISGEWNGKARADGINLGVQFEAKQQEHQIEGSITVTGTGGVSKHIVTGDIDESGRVIHLHDTAVEKVSGRRKFLPVLIDEYELRLKDDGITLTGECKAASAKKGIALTLEKRLPLGTMIFRGNDPKDHQDRQYVENTKKAYELGEQAKKLVIAERYAEAESLYREGVKLGENGNAASIHCDLGVVLEMQEKYDEAKAEFEEAIRLDAKYSTAIYNLATCYLNSGNLDEAKVRFTKFIADYPDAVDRKEAVRLLALLNDPSMIDTRTGKLKPNILAANPR